jgi:transposase InsO family protein
MDTGLSAMTVQALNRAIIVRQPEKELIHHSDRGSQYVVMSIQTF